MESSSKQPEWSKVGIPTTYKGVEMRSRLEAKWARVFDHFGWRWTYEPFDAAGYIPDFLIVWPHRQAIVDIKPAPTLRQCYDRLSVLPEFPEATEETEVWVLGAYYHRGDYFDDGTSVVAIGAREDNNHGALTVVRCPRCRSTVPMGDGAWTCAVCGTNETEDWVAARKNRLTSKEFERLWADATNYVKWRKKK